MTTENERKETPGASVVDSSDWLGLEWDSLSVPKPTEPGTYILWLSFGWDSFADAAHKEVVKLERRNGELAILDRPNAGEVFPLRKLSRHALLLRVSNVEDYRDTLES